jgi:hypothetical protein
MPDSQSEIRLRNLLLLLLLLQRSFGPRLVPAKRAEADHARRAERPLTA